MTFRYSMQTRKRGCAQCRSCISSLCSLINCPCLSGHNLALRCRSRQGQKRNASDFIGTLERFPRSTWTGRTGTSRASFVLALRSWTTVPNLACSSVGWHANHHCPPSAFSCCVELWRVIARVFFRPSRSIMGRTRHAQGLA